MVVTVFDGPGVETYRSTAYSIEVDGSPSYVYEVIDTAQHATRWWDATDTVSLSWLTYTAEETTEVVVTRLAGAITSAVIYPLNKNISFDIADDVLTIQVPANTRILVDINNPSDNDNAFVLFINSEAPYDAVPAGAVEYDGTQVVAAQGETLYFPAGVWNLLSDSWGAKLFPVESGASVYAHPNAWIIGSFDVRQTTETSLKIYGTLSGEWITELTTPTKTQIRAMSWDDASQYSLIVGYYIPNPSLETSNRVIQNATLVNSPFHHTTQGATVYSKCKFYSPWWNNTDGFDPVGDVANSNISIVEDSCAFTGDDNFKAYTNWGDQRARNLFLINSASVSMLLAYWPFPRYGPTSINEIDCLNLGVYTINAGGNIIKLWLDGEIGEEAYGRFDWGVGNVRVDGPIAGRLFMIENRDYPWGTPNGDEIGQAAFGSLSHITCTHVPAYTSNLKGTDAVSTPHDLTFTAIKIAGVFLDRDNWSTYVDQNEFPYNITINGQYVSQASPVGVMGYVQRR